MNRIAILLIVLLGALLWAYFNFASQAGAAETDFNAREVVAQSWKNFQLGVKTELEEANARVVYESGYVEEKSMIRRTLYQSDGNKVSIEFTSPRRVEGLKLLVWQSEGAPDDIWLQMPSLSRPRRVSGRNEGRFFADTDFTFRDTNQLAGENLSGYTYEFLDSNEDHWKIKALPKENIKAVYSKRIFHIEKKSLVIKKIDYFRGERLNKTQYNKDIEWHGQAWRPNRIVIENEFQDRRTEFQVINRQINPEIPMRFWQKSFLR
ncbi:MAG: outer membrane lipoprotein-sorting protein [Candidatus Moranbacteria bacterium]|nr:outer membrane lipoprotein-sorting protein [Candidatus Moranbacteria bacterium]